MKNPIGKQLTLRSLWSHERADFTVTGVADPIPDNSSIQFEMFDYHISIYGSCFTRKQMIGTSFPDVVLTSS